MTPGLKELALRPEPKGADHGLGVHQCSNIGAQISDSNFRGRRRKKRHAGACRPKPQKSRLRPSRPGYFPCFAYQSELIGVKLFHFSGRSSSAKIAVTGQTGTQAPQSMHSVGWM